MTLMHTIYEKLPEWGQNLFVSAYGCKLYYERYFHGNSMLTDLLRSQWLTDAEIRDNQLAELKKLLCHAQDTVPYYRGLFRQKRFNPENLRSIEALAELPLLGKETVRTGANELLSNRFSTGSLIPLNTSGTSGKSLRVFVDLESRRRTYSFTGRFHRWAGLENSRHNITLGGRTIIPVAKRNRTFWRYNAAMDNYLFSTYHLSDGTLPLYIEKIREIRPQFIESYPSAVYLLARFMDERSLDGIYPRAVITSGETLFDYQREVIERVFRCRVFDQYGCTEQALFVSQCEQGSYHVHPEYGIVEILDDNDRPLGAGKAGRVVCTSFVNQAMPLIRYDLGDVAEWDAQSCGCGRHFPVIKKIVGRQDDYIVTPDGKKIGRLDPIFKGVTSIKNAQIVQTGIHAIELNIVPCITYNSSDEKLIVDEFRKRVGADMSIKVNMVDSLQKTNNGKIKAVISLVQ